MTLLVSPRSGNAGDLVDVARAGAELLLVVDSATLPPPDLTSDDIENASDAPGATVSDALNGIGGAVASLPGSIAGTGLRVVDDQLSPRVRPRLQTLTDLFSSGTQIAGGGIGALGWHLLGTGTPVYTRSDTSLNSTQKNGLTTSAALGDRSVLTLGDTETRDVVTAATINLLQTVARSPSLLSQRYFFGLLATFATEPNANTDALGFAFDSAVSPNWLLINRSGGVGVAVNSGVPMAGDAGELLTLYQSTPGFFQFWTGNTLLGTTVAAVSPAGMNCGFRLENLAASSKTVRINYFNLEAATTGAYATDAFLQGPGPSI